MVLAAACLTAFTFLTVFGDELKVCDLRLDCKCVARLREKVLAVKVPVNVSAAADDMAAAKSRNRNIEDIMVGRKIDG